jgi:hypothetical protein
MNVVNVRVEMYDVLVTMPVRMGNLRELRGHVEDSGKGERRDIG